MKSGGELSKQPIIGLALGAGGARGWCHIGVLRGLEALGVKPDLVAGCSMGALVGAAWADGKLDQLEQWVRALTPARVLRLLDFSLRRSGGLVEARGIEGLLADLGVADRIENLAKPFGAVATDMETGREIWLRDGPTYPAVRSSASIPGVISPKRHQGMWLLDGGLTNPVPVSTARAMGADIIIAVNPNARPNGRFWQEPEPRSTAAVWAASVLPKDMQEMFGIVPDSSNQLVTPNYFAVLNAAIDVMEAQIRRARLAGEPPHVLLNAGFPDMTILELYRGVEAIEEGRRIVDLQADTIRKICGLCG